MNSVILSARDVDFLLHEWLDTDALFERPTFAQHSRETVDAVLELAQAVATEKFAPHARSNDLHEPTFDGTTVSLIPEVGVALKAFADAGFLTAGVPEDRGGGGCGEGEGVVRRMPESSVPLEKICRAIVKTCGWRVQATC